jgi:DNA-binding transcriptional LysR family regulator
MSRLPSLNGLRAFEVAARHQSFTGAAAELNVTQAAVSRAVKSLESQLGYGLFERHANRLLPTPDARALLPELTSAFGLMEKALERVAAARRSPVLTVGAGPTFAIRWLIPRLARFQQLHPDIDVHTTTAGPTAALRPEWTCSLRLGRDPTSGAVSEPLFSPRMTPVCNPRVAARLKTPADLYKVALLDVAPTPDDWPLWLQAAGLDMRRVDKSNVFPFHAFALQAALDGLGVAMGLHPYVVDDVQAGRLVAPFALQVDKPVGWYLAYRKESLSNPAFQRFRRWVRGEARA